MERRDSRPPRRVQAQVEHGQNVGEGSAGKERQIVNVEIKSASCFVWAYDDDPKARSFRRIASMSDSLSVARSRTWPIEGEAPSLTLLLYAAGAGTEEEDEEDTERRLRAREALLSSFSLRSRSLWLALTGDSGIADSPDEAVLTAVSEGTDEVAEFKEEAVIIPSSSVPGREGILGMSTFIPSPVEAPPLDTVFLEPGAPDPKGITGELVRRACFCFADTTGNSARASGSVFERLSRPVVVDLLKLGGGLGGVLDSAVLDGLPIGAMRSERDFCISNKPSSMLPVCESIDKAPRCSTGLSLAPGLWLEYDDFEPERRRLTASFDGVVCGDGLLLGSPGLGLWPRFAFMTSQRSPVTSRSRLRASRSRTSMRRISSFFSIACLSVSVSRYDDNREYLALWAFSASRSCSMVAGSPPTGSSASEVGAEGRSESLSGSRSSVGEDVAVLAFPLTEAEDA